MRITIEDLEALKELNDEIEEDHVETEKSLQKELGQSRESLNRDILTTTLQTQRMLKSGNRHGNSRFWMKTVKIWKIRLLSSEISFFNFRG
jgi:hypothetical protein